MEQRPKTVKKDGNSKNIDRGGKPKNFSSNQGRPNQDRRSSGQNKSGGGKKSQKTVDPVHFVNKAEAVDIPVYVSERFIKDLPVDKAIIENLLEKGYQKPTEIQDKTIEAILDGRDLMGLAKTGTGKTGAFLIPLIHRLLGTKPGFQVLIVSPTRELALQITDEFDSISKGLRLFSHTLIGGTNVQRDLDKMRRPAHFVIGTPGRIHDMASQRALSLSNFSVLVLDEFDRLLDMGFSKDILRMVEGMKRREQTVLFSATEEKGQKQLLERLLTRPVEVRVSEGNVTADNIDQDVIVVKQGENKMDVLIAMLKKENFSKVLVFAETKRWVSKVCKSLQAAGILADEIHGNKSQNYRIKALDAFKHEKIKVLVATDVAARGLDIPEVSHVINYQAPKDIDSYIHRIGRTGRAGKSGKAYTFVE